jgi:uncharacterized protein YggE
MKNTLIGLVLALALALALAGPCVAQENTLSPRVTVTGEGSVSVPPDLARYSAGVVSEAKTAREAAAANAKAMSAVMAAIKAAGIADKDVQTANFAINPVYGKANLSNGSDNQTIVGFRVSNRVMVTLHDLTKVGDTIDALVSAGANSAGGIEFTVAEPSKVLDPARTEAVADARRKAELYAKAAGQTLGPALALTEEVANTGPVFMARAALAQGPTTPVAAGETTLRVSVAATFALKP